MIDSEAPENRLHQHVPNEILQLNVLLMQMKESNLALQIMKSLFLFFFFQVNKHIEIPSPPRGTNLNFSAGETHMFPLRMSACHRLFALSLFKLNKWRAVVDTLT